MKVGTDGVLLGAWANTTGVKTVLDIGTGTGLIALMLAQRQPAASIEAIDIDENAVLQAKENIAKSDFRNISCTKVSFQEFAFTCQKKYDLIVSNPPYFNNSLLSPDSKRSLARHTNTLGCEGLIQLSAGLLTEKGRLSLVYPYGEKETILSFSEKYGLYVSSIVNVHTTPQSDPKRILIELSKQPTNFTEAELIIEIERHKYSPEFVKLVKDFYLKM